MNISTSAAKSRQKKSSPINSSNSNSSVPPLIALQEVSRAFGGAARIVQALERVSFEINSGDFVSIVGASGCGKSTLLKIISGLLPPSSGKVVVNGAPVTGALDNVGMVFQSPVLLKWRSVLDNVLLPVEFARRDVAAHLDRARQLLTLVGLAGFEEMYPHQLSGGMQQRVSLCRALVTDPDLLLMDEPFGALDAMTRDELDAELLRIWEEKKKTVLFVTHSIQEAVFLSDYVLVMSARPGRLLEIISIDLPRPRTVEMMSSGRFGEYTLKIRALLAVSTGSSATAGSTA
jgi:NitT/TauT family transport system ATP-binding protein